MSNINDLPPTTTGPGFGESFNYNVWTPDTQIELCNVPWNSDYRDIVNFDDQAALDTYLNGVTGPKIRISKMTLARAGDPVRINLPFNLAYKYNYLRVVNGTQPVSARYFDNNDIPHTVVDAPKTLYYFIQDIRYLAPNTTELVVMLDVWQTFGREIEFGNCYIDRGHVGIANENQFDHQGRDFLTVPEGLDIGAEYNINESYKFSLPDDTPESEIEVSGESWVIMGIAADLSVDPGTVDNPSLNIGRAGIVNDGVNGLPVGFDTLMFRRVNDFQSFISTYNEYPWVLQTIMYISVVPKIQNDRGTFADSWDEVSLYDPVEGGPRIALGVYRPKAPSSIMIERNVANNFRDRADDFIPARYSYLKKFLVAPYTMLELTTYNATPLILRPELIPGDDLNICIFQHFAPPSPRWAIVPKHYNATGEAGGYDDGEYLDFATYITNFPQFTVVNSGYLQYLASNRNTIAYQYGQADWSQQKTMQGADIGLENELRATQAAARNAEIQRNLNTSLTTNRNLASAGDLATSGTRGLVAGNPAAALGSMASAGLEATINVMKNNSDNAHINTANLESTLNTVAATNTSAQRNNDLAKYASKGDYQQAIAAINARVQDAKLIQPTVVGQMGGEGFIGTLFDPVTVIHPGETGVGWNVWTKIKQINKGMMYVIGEYWLRYGYAVNRFANLQDTGLKCMSKFTYWKLKETYIISNECPESFKQSIRGIFEKGVTVWTNPTDIGNIDLATNTPLSGISL